MLSNLKSFSIRVATSRTKLLVIMHADKVSAENETNFQGTLSLCSDLLVLKSIEGHLVTYHQMIYPKLEIKLT